MRAFNPDLILLSSGFDAASGDVGNCRHQANSPVVKGMDLTPDDFAWATQEVMKIADICCNGRVVSVLEGGYGEYETNGPSKQRSYGTRSSRRGDDENMTVEIDANAVVSNSFCSELYFTIDLISLFHFFYQGECYESFYFGRISCCACT